MANLSTTELNRMAKNTGCRMHDDCLTCPLPACVYDTPNGLQRIEAVHKQANIRTLSKHLSVNDIAKQLSVSTRTVQRALEGEANG